MFKPTRRQTVTAAAMATLASTSAALWFDVAQAEHATKGPDVVAQTLLRDRPPLAPVALPLAQPPTAVDASLSFIGVLLPAQATDVAAPQPGLVERVCVELGEQVEPGQALVSLAIQQAKLDHVRAEAEREAARAALERARIEQSHALAEAKRSEQLAAEGLVTQEELAQARFKQSESRANAIEAESRLRERAARAEQLSLLRDQTRVVARFRGKVAVRYVTAGAQVNAGTPLLRLISDEAVLRFAIPEQHSGLREGSVVSFVPEEHPELAFAAKVVRLSPEIDAASRMRTLEALPLDQRAVVEQGLVGALVRVSLDPELAKAETTP